jgi:hypothetical protein
MRRKINSTASDSRSFASHFLLAPAPAFMNMNFFCLLSKIYFHKKKRATAATERLQVSHFRRGQLIRTAEFLCVPTFWRTPAEGLLTAKLSSLPSVALHNFKNTLAFSQRALRRYQVHRASLADLVRKTFLPLFSPIKTSTFSRETRGSG